MKKKTAGVDFRPEKPMLAPPPLAPKPSIRLTRALNAPDGRTLVDAPTLDVGEILEESHSKQSVSVPLRPEPKQGFHSKRHPPPEADCGSPATQGVCAGAKPVHANYGIKQTKTPLEPTLESKQKSTREKNTPPGSGRSGTSTVREEKTSLSSKGPSPDPAKLSPFEQARLETRKTEIRLNYYPKEETMPFVSGEGASTRRNLDSRNLETDSHELMSFDFQLPEIPPLPEWAQSQSSKTGKVHAESKRDPLAEKEFQAYKESLCSAASGILNEPDYLSSSERREMELKDREFKDKVSKESRSKPSHEKYSVGSSEIRKNFTTGPHICRPKRTVFRSKTSVQIRNSESESNQLEIPKTEIGSPLNQGSCKNSKSVAECEIKTIGSLTSTLPKNRLSHSNRNDSVSSSSLAETTSVSSSVVCPSTPSQDSHPESSVRQKVGHPKHQLPRSNGTSRTTINTEMLLRSDTESRFDSETRLETETRLESNSPPSSMMIFPESSLSIESSPKTDIRIENPSKPDSSGKEFLKTIGLTKSYYKGKLKIPVLKGVDLTVRQGEFISIVGQSGSGKSTLLHLLGTLDNPDGGTIHFNDRRIDNLSIGRRDLLRNRSIGFIFQFYHLLPELTTLENVLSPLMIRESVWGYFFRRRSHIAKAKEILEQVGLSHRLKHKPSELSGGEMQRAAIARALISSPEILLADEPTGNLDSSSAREIIELLKRLNREHRLTIVMVTHDNSIAAVADRIVRMVDGVIV